MFDGKFHTIITKIYDSKGEVVKIVSSTVPGDYEIIESEQKYHDWLDERREDNEMGI